MFPEIFDQVGVASAFNNFNNSPLEVPTNKVVVVNVDALNAVGELSSKPFDNVVLVVVIELDPKAYLLNCAPGVLLYKILLSLSNAAGFINCPGLEPSIVKPVVVPVA